MNARVDNVCARQRDPARYAVEKAGMVRCDDTDESGSARLVIFASNRKLLVAGACRLVLNEVEHDDVFGLGDPISIAELSADALDQ